MTEPVGLAWTLSSFHGWGILGTQLALALIRRGRMPLALDEPSLSLPETDWRLLAPALEASRDFRQALPDPQGRYKLGFPVIHAVHNRLAYGGRLSGAPDLGIVFLENTHLDAEALARGRNLDRLVAGCRWGADILKAKGLTDVVCAVQGIDPALFFPAPKKNRFPGRFVVFSGGKLEFRKGQDLVVAGFRRFQARHPEALLLTAWQNPWPKTSGDLARTGPTPEANAQGAVDVKGWVRALGVPEGAHRDLGLIAHALLPDWVREADLGVFASRCEGGTNLMAMETLAAGVPCILSANTGHRDLLAELPAWPLTRQLPVIPVGPEEGTEGWGESDPDEIDFLLEKAWQNSAAIERMGHDAAQAMRAWDWPAKADAILKALAL
ncbi:MAG: glycosyltransferase [Rhodospirillales bacterium]|nr:glycosyltransferase [Rhodospirillales bacterium]